MRRAVMTIATGHANYRQMAINLARSFGRWHRESDIGFVLATDSPKPLPPDLDFVHVRRLAPQEIPPGFAGKLYMDRLSPAEQTLFIDSDCLCVANLEGVFERMRGNTFTVVGRGCAAGEFFGDIEQRRSTFSLNEVPVFVGAVYYFERGLVADKVFGRARQLVERYDELGFVRLRGKPNEEPLLSVAMAENNQAPIPDTGDIKADAMDCEEFECEVLAGSRRVVSRALGRVEPAIMHFNDSFTATPCYGAQMIALRLQGRLRLPRAIASALGTLAWGLPRSLWMKMKDRARPTYRRFFGVRRVRSVRA